MMRLYALACVAVCAVLWHCPGCSESNEQTPTTHQEQAPDAATPPVTLDPREQAKLQPTQQSVVITPGLYDTTERWRKRFGLDGKLKIENGRRDDRLSYADGPIQLSFDATPTQPGIYTFVFALIYHDGLPSQIQAIHLYAIDGHDNENPVSITPGPHGVGLRKTVAPGQTVKVYWVPGGGLSPVNAPTAWRLSEVVYTQSTDLFQTPGIPRYECIEGE